MKLNLSVKKCNFKIVLTLKGILSNIIEQKMCLVIDIKAMQNSITYLLCTHPDFGYFLFAFLLTFKRSFIGNFHVLLVGPFRFPHENENSTVSFSFPVSTAPSAPQSRSNFVVI